MFRRRRWSRTTTAPSATRKNVPPQRSSFAPDHTVKLVLLGSDAPYLRNSNDAAFTVQVTNLTVTLPTV
jgi:hypothetical protein